MQSDENIQQQPTEAVDNSNQSTTVTKDIDWRDQTNVAFFTPQQQSYNEMDHHGWQQLNNTASPPLWQHTNQNSLLGPLHIDTANDNSWPRPTEELNNFLQWSPAALIPITLISTEEFNPPAMPQVSDGQFPDLRQRMMTSMNPQQPINYLSPNAVQQPREELTSILNQNSMDHIYHCQPQEIIAKLPNFQQPIRQSHLPGLQSAESKNHPADQCRSDSANPHAEKYHLESTNHLTNRYRPIQAGVYLPDQYRPDSINQHACRPDSENRHANRLPSNPVSHSAGRLQADSVNYDSIRLRTDPINYHAELQKLNSVHHHAYIQQKDLKNHRADRLQVDIRTKPVAHKRSQHHSAGQIQLDIRKKPVEYKKQQHNDPAKNSRMKMKNLVRYDLGLQAKHSTCKNAEQQTENIACHDVGQQTDNLACDNVEHQADKPACRNVGQQTEDLECHDVGKQFNNPVSHDAWNQTDNPACVDVEKQKKHLTNHGNKNKNKHMTLPNTGKHSASLASSKKQTTKRIPGDSRPKNKNISCHVKLQAKDTSRDEDQLKDLAHQYERHTLNDLQNPNEGQKLVDEPQRHRKNYPSKDPLHPGKNQQAEGHWCPSEDLRAGNPLRPCTKPHSVANPFHPREERLKDTSHLGKEPLTKDCDPCPSLNESEDSRRHSTGISRGYQSFPMGNQHIRLPWPPLQWWRRDGNR